jgi:hypothetical protein
MIAADCVSVVSRAQCVTNVDDRAWDISREFSALGGFYDDCALSKTFGWTRRRAAVIRDTLEVIADPGASTLGRSRSPLSLKGTAQLGFSLPLV